MLSGRGIRQSLLAAALLLCIAAPSAAGFYRPSSLPRVSGNPAERLAGTPADPLSTYHSEKGRRCTKAVKPGTKRFIKFLKYRFKRGRMGGTSRCENLGGGLGYSMHSESRAIDWTVSASNRRDRQAVDKLIRLLLAPDSAGLEAALARRMGVFEIIWDCGYWSHDQQRDGRGFINYFLCPSPYDEYARQPSRTIAHRDHIHFSLSRAGAAGTTSFWR